MSELEWESASKNGPATAPKPADFQVHRAEGTDCLTQSQLNTNNILIYGHSNTLSVNQCGPNQQHSISDFVSTIVHYGAWDGLGWYSCKYYNTPFYI